MSLIPIINRANQIRNTVVGDDVTVWVLKDNSWKMDGFWINEKLWTL